MNPRFRVYLRFSKNLPLSCSQMYSKPLSMSLDISYLRQGDFAEGVVFVLKVS